MSKLLHLKPWVSTHDAAALLSNSLAENVSEADIYRLALDGHLRLSIYLPNGVLYKRFEPIAIADVEARIGRKMRGEFESVNDADGRMVVCFQGQWLVLTVGQGRDVAYVEGDGLLDVPLFGTERGEVESEFQRLTGGAVLLNRGKTFPCVLTDTGLAVAISHLVSHTDPQDPEAVGSAVLHRLTDAGKFVVRPAELARFAASLESGNEAPGANAATRRQRTLLTIVAALCKRAGIDPAARGAAMAIASATEELGAPVGDDAIRAMLKAIPDAIESRSR